jgi:lipoprotein-anchoring transpeptidase ErfK/SrfK
MNGSGAVPQRTGGSTARRRGWRVASVAALVGAVLVTGACTSDGSPIWQDGKGGAPEQQGPQITAAITTPASESTDVLATTAVEFTTQNADDATVEVKDAAGNTVEGRLAEDGKSWQPAKALAWGITYTATVTATGAEGKTGTAVSRFTVMKKPANLVRATSFLGDGQIVGVGMPMIIRFSRSIPQKYRADVERRLTLESNPKHEGTWNWYSPTEIHYRPKSFWKPNTKITYQVQLAGVPMGDGWYGRSDMTVDLKVGRAFVMSVDNNTKQMTVTENGKVIRTIPVSLGKKSTPSSSGTMVVIEKKRKTVFDTMDELPEGEGYRTDIDYAQRLTWGGEFIHAAPWSEGVQGRVNVSHGCVNVSMKEGAWLFERTMLGDPITVKGTSRKLQNGNGWTDWNMSWDEYKKGSAL